MKSYANKNLSILPQWARDYIEDLNHEIDRLQAIKEMHAILTEKNRTWFTLPGPEHRSDRDVIKLWILNQDDPLQVAALYKGDKLFIGRRKEVEYDRPQTTVERKDSGKGQVGAVFQRRRGTRNGKKAGGEK